MRPEDFIPRLAFIRYLYGVAVEQSRQPLPMGTASLLGFQDSVELFLVLAAEHLNATIKDRTPFDDYFGVVNDALAKAGRQGMTGAEPVKKLNKARVGLKHHGIWPAPQEIERFRNQTDIFFEDNTPLVFDGVCFADVSLVDIVQPTEVQDSLREAQRLAGEGQVKVALAHVGTAFWQLMGDYAARQQAAFGRSPFYFQAALTAPPPKPRFEDYDHFSYRTLDDTTRIEYRVQRVEDIANALCLGLDINRYVWFRQLTADDSDVTPDAAANARVPSDDDFRFCFDFVVDSALRLQQSGFASGGTDTP